MSEKSSWLKALTASMFAPGRRGRARPPPDPPSAHAQRQLAPWPSREGRRGTRAAGLREAAPGSAAGGLLSSLLTQSRKEDAAAAAAATAAPGSDMSVWCAVR